MAEVANAKKNPLKSIGKFFREVRAEMKKVIWPGRKQLTNNTLIVIAAVVIIGIFIWVLDIIFQLGIFNFITGESGL